MGLSNPDDEIHLYHTYVGDVSSIAVLRHSTAANPDVMLLFTLKNDHQLYYKGYSDFKAFLSETNKQIIPNVKTIWNGRTYPVIIQNNCSIDTIYITIGEQLVETAEQPNITMKIGVWTTTYNTTTRNFIFNGDYSSVEPNFVEVSYKRPAGIYIDSTRLKTWHFNTGYSNYLLYNWIEPNISIYIRRSDTNAIGCALTYIEEADRIATVGSVKIDSTYYVVTSIIGKLNDTNELYIQYYRSKEILEDLLHKSGTETTMIKHGPCLLGGVYMEEDIPTTNTYIGNWYTINLPSYFTYYSGGRLIVIGYNVYLLNSTYTEAKLILKLQRWDHWVTGSANDYDKVYVIRGKEYTLVISYDPDKVYNTSTVAPYNMPFLLYKHDAYIGDNIVVDNTRLRFVSSSKGIYYDNTDVNSIKYAVIVHGNIKSPDMDSIYRTIDDLYKRIAQLESKITSA